MKSKLLITCLVLSISGCATVSNDMLHNKFVGINPQPVPSAFVGTYTGATGPWLTTVILNSNGSGVSCATYNGKTQLDKVKYSEGKLFYQNGVKVTLQLRDLSSYMMTVSYYGVTQDYVMYKDADLSNASLQCSSQLKGIE